MINRGHEGTAVSLSWRARKMAQAAAWRVDLRRTALREEATTKKIQFSGFGNTWMSVNARHLCTRHRSRPWENSLWILFKEEGRNRNQQEISPMVETKQGGDIVMGRESSPFWRPDIHQHLNPKKNSQAKICENVLSRGNNNRKSRRIGQNSSSPSIREKARVARTLGAQGEQDQRGKDQIMLERSGWTQSLLEGGFRRIYRFIICVDGDWEEGIISGDLLCPVSSWIVGWTYHSLWCWTLLGGTGLGSGVTSDTSYPELSQTWQAKGTAHYNTALTSDTSHKFGDPQATWLLTVSRL